MREQNSCRRETAWWQKKDRQGNRLSDSPGVVVGTTGLGFAEFLADAFTPAECQNYIANSRYECV